MTNPIDTRTLEQKIADWERELADAKAQLAATEGQAKSEADLLIGFERPERKMIEASVMIEVMTADDVVHVLSQHPEVISKQWEFVGREGVVWMYREFMRPETDPEYAKSVSIARQRYIEAARTGLGIDNNVH